MVGFCPDKINILQHIKPLFSAKVLVPGVLDGMNTVYIIMIIMISNVYTSNIESIILSEKLGLLG